MSEFQSHQTIYACIGNAEGENQISIRLACWIDESNSIISAASIQTGAATIYTRITTDEALEIRDAVEKFLHAHLDLSHRQAIEAEAHDSPNPSATPATNRKDERRTTYQPYKKAVQHGTR